MSAAASARVGGRVQGSAVVYVPEDDVEVRVRWHHHRGWYCDAHGRSRTARCQHVTAAAHTLTAHLLTVDLRTATARREDHQ